jgi:hypothetical protein
VRPAFRHAADRLGRKIQPGLKRVQERRLPDAAVSDERATAPTDHSPEILQTASGFRRCHDDRQADRAVGFDPRQFVAAILVGRRQIDLVHAEHWLAPPLWTAIRNRSINRTQRRRCDRRHDHHGVDVAGDHPFALRKQGIGRGPFSGGGPP